MAKFELIKIVKPALPKPQTYWFTQKDGHIITGSLFFNIEEATKAFNDLIQCEVQEETREVIQTFEIHENDES
jgi:hypothetical protein